MILDKNISFTMVDSLREISPYAPEDALGMCRIRGNTADIVISYKNDPENLGFVLRHELGHAVDFTHLGSKSALTAQADFLKVYRSDLSALTAAEVDKLKMYCRPGGIGAEETFASMYAHTMGAETNFSREILLKEKFPDTFDYMNKFVDKLRGAQQI